MPAKAPADQGRSARSFPQAAPRQLPGALSSERDIIPQITLTSRKKLPVISPLQPLSTHAPPEGTPPSPCDSTNVSRETFRANPKRHASLAPRLSRPAPRASRVLAPPPRPPASHMPCVLAPRTLSRRASLPRTPRIPPRRRSASPPRASYVLVPHLRASHVLALPAPRTFMRLSRPERYAPCSSADVSHETFSRKFRQTRLAPLSRRRAPRGCAPLEPPRAPQRRQ